MTTAPIDQLAVLIYKNRDALLSEWRRQVRQLPSAAQLDTPTLNDHIPALIEELIVALKSKSDETIPEVLNEGTPPAHGLQRLIDGFDIEEVVAEYNILRGCIHNLADAHNVNLQGQAFHILNRLLDGSIGAAVQAYAARQAIEAQQRREEHLAFIAHDLRTPLSAISLATKILELKLPQNDMNNDVNQMIRTLRRNVQHLDALVSKMIDESTYTTEAETNRKLERRTFDLWPLVEAMVQALSPLAQIANTQLVNDVPYELSVDADAALLKRIFQNLITNALRYTPRGEIIVGAKALEDNRGIECWVSDNGAGIPNERIGNVFEAFATETQTDGVSGLGLAIVKTFVEAHGGQVTIESREGKGSTCRFMLPSVETAQKKDATR